VTAQARVTGPVTIFGNPRAKGFGGQPRLLGTGEVAPTSEIRHEFEPVMNDITGSRVPFDELYEGSHGFSVVDLTWWDENTLFAMESLPNRPASVRGSVGITGDIGALMITEGLSYEMWFVSTAADRFPDMPSGDHFFASWLMGPAIRTKGTRANKIHCVWRHLPQFVAGKLTLFDHDIKAVAGIPVI
jgi:hypothetical protein